MQPRQPSNTPRYRIRTPAATSAVRGTHFRSSAQAENQTSTTEVLAGTVGVAGYGRSHFVPAGFGILAAVGIPPEPPKPLLGAPDLSKVPDRFERIPFAITVPLIDDAVAYRFQVAADPSFRTLYFDQVSDVARISVRDLPDGDYTLRVRGIDADGLDGRDESHRFIVNARPAPPVLLAPPADARLSLETPEFRWSRPVNAIGYHFQLAPDRQFKELLVDSAEVETEHLSVPQRLPPGHYYWRIATRSEDGEIGPWGDVQYFKRLAAAPDLKPPEVQADGVLFRWSSGLPGDRYEFQLARDAAFTQLVHSEISSESKVRIEHLGSGNYFLRVRTLDGEGDAEPLGLPHSVHIPLTNYWPLAIFVRSSY